MDKMVIDKDGLLLCELQAKAFELSVDKVDTSSEIFMRRCMNSYVIRTMDSGSILDTNMQEKDILAEIELEYGASTYGSVKYNRNEMYWIGYLYRYFAYTYGLSSTQIYKIVKPKELRALFLPYHTMDPAQAIERILEAKGIVLDTEDSEAVMQRHYEIFKRIRMEKKK